MSADSFVAYIGLRFSVTPRDVEAVELRTDSRMVVARRCGLTCYWGQSNEAYFLLIGTEIGVFGVENLHEASILSDVLEDALKSTQLKLAAAAFGGKAALHLLYIPDL